MEPATLNNLYLVIVAAVVTLVTPVATVFAQSWSRKADREEDRKDRAAVAAQVVDAAHKAEGAAKLLVDSNAAVAAQVVQVAAVAAKADERTNGQLKQIHTLVNSNLTTSMQGELNQCIAHVVSMKELAALKKSINQTLTPETAATLAVLEARIAELKLQLLDRTKAADIVAKEQAANPVEQK